MYRRFVSVVAFLGLTLWLVGCMSLGPQVSPLGGKLAVAAGTGTVTVEVKDSAGAPIQGASVHFYKPGPGGRDFPKTDSNGQSTGTLPETGNWNVTVSVFNTSQSKTVYIDTDPVTITFQTSKITVKLETCAGTPLAGGNVHSRGNVSAGTWFYWGKTGPDGTISKEIFPGNWWFSVEYQQTYTEKQQDVGANPVVTFKTTKVWLYHSGAISYRGYPSAGTFFTFTNGMEMLPGTIKFNFQGIGEIPITISGCEYKAALVVVELKDSSGAPLNGGKIYRKGGPVSPGTWFYFGTTGADGKYVGLLTPGYNYDFSMEYNMTSSQQSGHVPTKLFYSFQTSKITVKLQTCAGVGLSGGKVTYRGSVSSGTWFTFGTTGSDGTVSKELFPGNWWFAVEYKQTKTEKQQDVGANPLVVFQTTKVTLYFSGNIRYRGNPSSGTLFDFTKPSMEMLPGTVRFVFNGPGYPAVEQAIDISGCSLEKTIAYVRLRDSNGQGVAGATAVWWPYGGSSTAVPGATNSNGALIIVMPGRVTANTAVALTYEDATQTKWQNNPSVNSFYDFQLVTVTVELRDNTGALIAGASPVVYYWPYGKPSRVFGTMVNGVVKKDLLPGHPSGYLFRIADFNKSSQQIGPFTINAPTTVVFQTGKVVDSGFGCLWYWQYGGPKGTFVDGIQLLPGNFYFQSSVTTKNLTVKAGQTLDIQTGTYTTP